LGLGPIPPPQLAGSGGGSNLIQPIFSDQAQPETLSPEPASISQVFLKLKIKKPKTIRNIIKKIKNFLAISKFLFFLEDF